jgi:hypothetical protein
MGAAAAVQVEALETIAAATAAVVAAAAVR